MVSSSPEKMLSRSLFLCSGGFSVGRGDLEGSNGATQRKTRRRRILGFHQVRKGGRGQGEEWRVPKRGLHHLKPPELLHLFFLPSWLLSLSWTLEGFAFILFLQDVGPGWPQPTQLSPKTTLSMILLHPFLFISMASIPPPSLPQLGKANFKFKP